MSSPQPQPIDVNIVINALNAEIARLNRVLENVPADVRIRAEEAAVAYQCPNCTSPLRAESPAGVEIGTPKE